MGWTRSSERKEIRFLYDFGNYITVGSFDTAKALHEGMEDRANVAMNSPYDFVNYISMGTLDLGNGAINPEESFSKEHWLSSIGLASIIAGGAKTIIPKPKTPSLEDQNLILEQTVTKAHELTKKTKAEFNFVIDEVKGGVSVLLNALHKQNNLAYSFNVKASKMPINVMDSESVKTVLDRVWSKFSLSAGKGTVKVIDYDLAKDYIRDVESKTGLKIHKAQTEQLKDALRKHKYEKLTPVETLKHRNKFNNVKDKLINEWEVKTGQNWPRYTEEVYDKNGRVVRDIGQPYDAHHIIENNFGGPHEWWNIHPAKFPDEHQAGIHGKGSPSNKLFPRR